MIINDFLVKQYFNGDSNLEDHWIFNVIEDGKHLFEPPSADLRSAIERLHNAIITELSDFHPFNEALFHQLFPEWQSLIVDVNVLLTVGCPSPFDAMVREYNGVEYIIFDLVRLHDYDDGSGKLVRIIKGMITHECTHICIHKDFPVWPYVSYQDKLEYITFDEGIAHVFSLCDDILHYDFSDMIEKHNQVSRDKLKDALMETSKDKQLQYLEVSNCGSYWQKFAAISGKLYFAANIDHIKELYENGPNHLLDRMGIQQ